ncbi:hypothetical protein MBLNU230_g0458t1 [Neophaeotheca triangularis]
MRLINTLSTCLATGLAVQTAAMSFTGQAMKVKPYKREPLQDIVTWDQHTLFVNDERILFYSGEFHPFRLPVPDLWLDIFQKIRALGYTGVSVYFDWALLEGKPGDFSAEGVFALEPFFEAASQAGIYLLARPGPYINAEVSGGGFPGWLQRRPGSPRTLDEGYINATENYARRIGELIGAAQITNGGPVIAFQPENELYSCIDSVDPCPNPEYMQYVEDQFRNASIVVPYIVNDNNEGNFAPGTGTGEVDIYGIDSYPLGFDCANPSVWPEGAIQTDLTETHLEYSPSTPFSFIEFQGGSFDPWGGWGFAQCYDLIDPAFERVFYKNNFASAITIFSIYMTYGGSNWGNLGYPGGYSSYDYAAVIREDRRVDREKYSEAKLEANFVVASPAYYTSTPGNLTNTTYTNTDELSVTPLFGNGSETNFYILRHSNFSSLENTEYKLTIPTSSGDVSVPQLGGDLMLLGRDSKVHVSDYKVGKHNLLYSSAEIFTWQEYGHRTVLVVYGGLGEHHELAVSDGGKASTIEGSGVKTGDRDGATVLNWDVSEERRIVQLGCGLEIHILNRQSAYDYWVLQLPGDTGLFTSLKASTAIVKAGYLMRNATVSHHGMNLVGDFNATTEVEVVGGAPSHLRHFTINGEKAHFHQDHRGVVKSKVDFDPHFDVPSLSSLDWKVYDSLPEIKPGYDDSAWPDADLEKTYNDVWEQTTPTSLFGSDYGFNTGVLVYRGHFIANGKESTIFLRTQGGSAFGSSAWINDSFLGAFKGYDAASDGNSTYTLPSLEAGAEYVITVLVDEMGMNQNYVVGADEMKFPRGILAYDLPTHPATDITWKLTGNLGGEDYADRSRGPLNEGGLAFERHGYHLPGAPINTWPSANSSSPFTLPSAGVHFYAADLALDLPRGWDIPMSFTFNNDTAPTAPAAPEPAPAYRVLLFVNGWQFGELVANIGPQSSFPVPEGILDYHGTNRLGLCVWNLEAGGAGVEGVELTVNGTVLSGFGEVGLAGGSAWVQREGVY